MNDIRLDGRQLPMENGSENAFVVEARNIITGCPSNNPCEGIHCNHPFECLDLWNLHECRYGELIHFCHLSIAISLI